MTELAELQKFFGQDAKAPATEIFSLWKNFFLEFNKAAEEVRPRKAAAPRKALSLPDSMHPESSYMVLGGLAR